MKIFEASQVRAIDDYTIREEPIASIDLMERAAGRLSGWYVRHFKVDRKVVIFAGPGNNGGDALAMARILAGNRYRVTCYLLVFGKRSRDCATNLERLKAQGKVELVELSPGSPLPVIAPGDVVVDGIFGSGLTRQVTGFPGEVIRHINSHASTVIAIDIPSGLFGEDNSENDYQVVVRAVTTLTFQFPFLSFFFRENGPFVGNWRVQDIRLHPAIISQTETPYGTIEEEEVRKMLPTRDRFSHKGTFGHSLVIAGSRGMMGAALMAGESCLRSGAGLVTLHVPHVGYTVAQTGFPEAIVSLDPSETHFSEPPDLSAYSSVAVGPGIGQNEESGRALRSLLESVRVPLVMDADGLNLLSRNPDWFSLLPRDTILTPHPGEFDRMAGKSGNGFRRHLMQMEFSRKYGVIVVLKGANTGISTPEGKYWFNLTGNPGMATGGSGDVLTGMIAGLLAQGMKSLDAAMAAVYLHGLAGDLAAGSCGQEALIAGDMIRHMGDAFRKVHKIYL